MVRRNCCLLTNNELLELSKIELENINPNMLQELTEIKIDKNMQIEEKINSFFHQIKNPYCFLVNGTPVQISFQNHNQTLDECLINYFRDKKNTDNTIL